MSNEKVTGLIAVVILVVIGFILYPLIGDTVVNMTDVNNSAYVGESAAPIVGMIPIFYFLGIALAVVGMSIVALRNAE